MTQFDVGENVLVRWGKQEGKKATILKSLLGDSYKVRMEDGGVRYFTGKGLEQSPQVEAPV